MNHSSFIRFITAERPGLTKRANAYLDQRLKRRVSASDIVQVTLAKAFGQRGALRVKHPRQIRVYLRSTLKNELIAQWRYHFRRKRNVALDQPLEEGHAAETTALFSAMMDPAESIMQEEEIRRLAKRVNALPDKLHKVIVGRYINGKKLSEIADEMHVSRDAAKRLHERAIRRLRSDMS